MAPEQCVGAQVEPRTDLYALGVVMYEALTGALPIVAKTRRELLDMHQRQIPTSMRLRRPDLPIPEQLDFAVMKSLKKRLNERPKNAAEMEKLLAAVPLDGLARTYPAGMARHPPSVRPSSDPETRTLQGIQGAEEPPTSNDVPPWEGFSPRAGAKAVPPG